MYEPLRKPPELEIPLSSDAPFIMFTAFTIVSATVLYFISKHKKKKGG
jgi:hypothetical protein